MESKQHQDKAEQPERDTWYLWLALIIIVVLGTSHFFLFSLSERNLFEKFFPLMFGLPFSMISAFLVISEFQHKAGPIEFKGIGFEFKGASAPTIMWVICFLALTTGIHLLVS